MFFIHKTKVGLQDALMPLSCPIYQSCPLPTPKVKLQRTFTKCRFLAMSISVCVWVGLKISRIKWVVIMFSLRWQSYLEIYMWCLILTTDLTNPVMYKILKIPPGWSPAFPCRFPCVVAPQRPMRSSAWGTSGMKSGSSPLCRLTCTHEAGKAMAFQQGTNYKWVK